MFKPCPFCGSANLESGGDDKIVAVRCRDCEATGPNHYGSRAEWNTRSLHRTEPQTAPDEICILCANGNDLPEGETCPGCKRAGHAVGLAAAVIKARGRNKPPSTPVIFDAAPADAASEPYTPPQVGEPCDAEGVKSIPDAVSLLRQWAKGLRANSKETVETIAIVNGGCVADDLDGIAAFLADVAAPSMPSGWREDMQS